MQEASKAEKFPLHRLSSSITAGTYRRSKRDILLGRFGKAKAHRRHHGFRRGAALCTQQLGRADHPGREVFDSPFTNACAHHFQMLTFLLGPTMRTACDIERAAGAPRESHD